MFRAESNECSKETATELPTPRCVNTNQADGDPQPPITYRDPDGRSAREAHPLRAYRSSSGPSFYIPTEDTLLLVPNSRSKVHYGQLGFV